MSNRYLKALAFVTMTVEVDAPDIYFYEDSPGVAAVSLIANSFNIGGGVKVVRMGVQVEEASFVASSKPDTEKGTP